jgi:P pilus assembly chaperone PapD
MQSRNAGRARSLALALVLLGPLAPRAARAQLAVNDLELFLAPSGRSGRAGVIQVRNTTAHSVQVQVDLQDWERDLDGRNVFRPTGAGTRGSCGPNLKAYPMSFRLNARGSAALRVSYEGSDSVGCWGIVFVQTNERPPAVRQSHLTYVVRTGVKVYVQPPQARRDGAIEGVRVFDTTMAVPGTRRPLAMHRAEVLFRNTGEAHALVKGSLEVRQADGSEAATIDVPEFPVVPGALRRLDTLLPALNPGHYLLVAMLDYGGDEIAAGQADFEVR